MSSPSPQTLLLIFFTLFSQTRKLYSHSDSTDLCKSISCNGYNTEIIFPFRLNTQPPSCGLKEFQLSCSDDDVTLLHLPFSGTYHVKEIDYLLHTITILDSNTSKCPIQTLLSLNLSNSTFTMPPQQYQTFSVMNCDDVVSWDGAVGPISCMSGGTNFVYLVDAYGSIEKLPKGCSSSEYSSGKIGSKLSLREGVERVLRTKEIEVGWEYGNRCKGCETLGGQCVGFNSTTQSVVCIHLNKAEGITTATATSTLTLGTCVVGSILLFVVVLLLSYRIQTSNNQKQIERKIEKFLVDYKSQSPIRYTYYDIKKMTKKFDHKLGQGGHGSVYRGNLPTRVPVAVKMLKNSKDGNEFTNEIATMSRIHHFNVVRLLGYSSEGARRALVYEYMPNESLHRLIASGEARALSWEKIEKIANGVARGIEYLHQGCAQRILHFDIKPQNILLDDNLQPKVSDFGMAMFCSKEESVVHMTNARGTEGYMAPELFSRNFGEVSDKSDVYSFGILLLEMVGARRNVGGDEESKNCFPEWIYKRMSEGERLGLEMDEDEDEDIVKKLGVVGLWCIRWDPKERPSMSMVIQMLESDSKLLDLPPKPFVSSDIEMGVS